jgi:hypothetical protein
MISDLIYFLLFRGKIGIWGHEDVGDFKSTISPLPTSVPK